MTPIAADYEVLQAHLAEIYADRQEKTYSAQVDGILSAKLSSPLNTSVHLRPSCSFHAGWHNGRTMPDPKEAASPTVNHRRTVFMAEGLGHGV